mmetsp:Transcript_1758/g.3156  ORF Transcript_1758/g.3156 Transcript_1758/m.3156 type:complete len:849 (+) Transcript_1758:216-2762(+)
MAEYALRHPMVWFVHFPFTPPGAEEHVVEEGIILNVKYSLRAGNALVIYCPRMDVIVELPLKTIIRKVKKVDVTPFQEKIMQSFDKNKDLISTNTKRLLRVSLSISDEKITAARNANLEMRREGSYSESDEDEDSEEDSEEEEESESEEDVSDEEEDEEEEDECLDFKVHILSSRGSEVRGFSVLRSKVIKRVMNILRNDYGETPSLFFKDDDGDEVAIVRPADLQYALRSHKKMKDPPAFRLYARMPEPPQESPESSSHTTMSSVTLHSDRVPSDLPSSPSSTAAMKHDNHAPIFGSPVKNRGTNIVEALDDDFHWQKGELVGVGSFGQVFGGVLVKTGRRIAVKEVSLSGPQREASLEQARALQVEIQILSTLDHPNIVQYLGAEFTSSALRIFLDLASEGSLKDHVNEFGSLSEPLLRKYMHDIVSGLGFLHSKRIIHRDIKPSNLLLDKGTVKLADFGASARVNLGEDDETEKGLNSVIGTAIYMSPEVMRGNDSENPDENSGYGRSTDIWSLGVTFCEMASGNKPYKNAAAAIFSVCVSKQYPTLPETMSEEAVSFLGRCLVDDPTARADCRELLAHPFCTEEYQYSNRSSFAKSHTFSSLTQQADIDQLGPLLRGGSKSELNLTPDNDGWGGSDEDTGTWGKSYQSSALSDGSSQDSRHRGSVRSTSAGGDEQRRPSRKLSKSSLSTIHSQGQSLEGISYRERRRMSLEQKEQDAVDEGDGSITSRVEKIVSKSVVDDENRSDNHKRDLRRKSIEEKQLEWERNDVTVRRHSATGLMPPLSGEEKYDPDGGVSTAASQRRRSLEAKQLDAALEEARLNSRRPSVRDAGSIGVSDDDDATVHH